MIGIAIFMLLMGAGIVSIWAMDMAKGKFGSKYRFFSWTNDGGDLMWPHILAEYITAACLIASGIAIFLNLTWSYPFTLISLGALFYTSLNSLSWVFADQSRLPYGIPMMVALAGSAIAIVVLVI